MKKLLLLFGLTICFLNSYSKDDDAIDTVKIRCLYRQSFVMDTTNINKETVDMMLLDVGEKISKYHNHDLYITYATAYKMRMDNKSDAEIAQFLINSQNSKSSRIEIYKNYPHKGTLTFFDNFGFETIGYEEPVPKMQWQLKNDTATVCGYLCKKATTTFKGRNYTVWYAPEIPTSDGPWKLNGLPGLILKAVDDQSYFSFICQSIEISKDIKAITLRKTRKEQKRVSKTAYEKAKQSYMDNKGAYMSGNPLAPQTLPPHNYQKQPYNPIEKPEK